MGKRKYLDRIEQLIAKSPVISYRSLERMVTQKKKSSRYVKQLVRNLVRKGKLKPLAKGYYATVDEVSLSVFCFQPAYLGLQDALSRHDLWEQETVPIIITTRKVRTGLRKVMGQNVLIRRIEPKFYFGIEPFQQDNYALPYSDMEKTLIDLIYFRQKLNPEVIREFQKKINPKKLNVYLKKYPLKTQNLIKRLINI